jgi:hypothetical protein
VSLWKAASYAISTRSSFLTIRDVKNRRRRSPKHHYDPKFHGVDLDKQIAAAKQRIEKVTTVNMALSNIAAVLDPLDDSHTFFLPLEHDIRHEYG